MSDKTFHKLHLDFIKACSGLEGRKDLPASIKKKAKEWCDKMQKHQFEGVAKLGKELEEDIKSFKSRARAHMTAGRKVSGYFFSLY